MLYSQGFFTIMLEFKTKLRVRYGETDQMGYVYYGNYAQYFEVARVEMLRSFGLSYKKMEEDGIMLPVVHFEVDYKKPAKYDDELTITSEIKELPTSLIKFNYSIHNQLEELLATGNTSLVFVDMKTGKPTRIPQEFLKIINKLI